MTQKSDDREKENKHRVVLLLAGAGRKEELEAIKKSKR
jgi:hypothetical protein